MRPTLIALTIALASPAVWAEYHRRPEDKSLVERPAPSPRTVARRTGLGLKGTASAATALQQAPGVVQINQKDPHNAAWFVATDVIPKGSTLKAFLVLPDQTEIPLDTLNATSDIEPGQSLALPSIRFGDFWPLGITSYEVDVTINRNVMVTIMDIPVGDAWVFSDLTKLAPLITSSTTQLNGQDVMLTMKGVFTSDPAYVVLEDMVAPRSAIRVSAGQITVNLSQVPGFDVKSLQDLLLTVGQAGYCDTAVFRYVPLQ
jgi:hypothetical protein